MAEAWRNTTVAIRENSHGQILEPLTRVGEKIVGCAYLNDLQSFILSSGTSKKFHAVVHGILNRKRLPAQDNINGIYWLGFFAHSPASLLHWVETTLNRMMRYLPANEQMDSPDAVEAAREARKRCMAHKQTSSSRPEGAVLVAEGVVVFPNIAGNLRSGMKTMELFGTCPLITFAYSNKHPFNIWDNPVRYGMIAPLLTYYH